MLNFVLHATIERGILFIISCACLLPLDSFAAEARVLVDHRSIDSGDNRIPPRWLDKARSLRVYFGHQSVGNNILDGLNALARRRPDRYSIEVRAEPDASWFRGHAGVGHFAVGENGDAWWTQPITNRDNAARNQFNALVRAYAAAQGKPLFDIADIESHDPRGGEAADRSGPALYAGYTRDGGHLTMEGRLRAARAWWWLLARLSGWPGSRGNDAAPPSEPAAAAPAAPFVVRSARTDWWSACTAEREKFCRGVPAGGGRVARCINAHAGELSDECKGAQP